MDKHRCTVCGYIHDPAEGVPNNDIAPDTSFKEVSDDWTCSSCGAAKSFFERVD